MKSKTDYENLKRYLKKLCVQEEFTDDFDFAFNFEEMESEYYEGKGKYAKVRKIYKKRVEEGESKYYAAKIYKKKMFSKTSDLNRGIIKELLFLRI